MKPGLLMLPSAVSDSRVHNILPNKIETDFQFSRASSATRVNHQGLIENVGYFSSELVQNGNFSELGSDVVINGDFSNGLNSWVTSGVELAQGGVRIESNGITGSFIKQAGILTLNKTYKLVFEVKSVQQTGSLRVGFASLGVANITDIGTYTIYFVANGSEFQFVRNSAINVIIDNVSVKQVDPNDRWTLVSTKFTGANTFENTATNGRIFQSFTTIVGSKYKVSVTINSGTWNIVASTNNNTSGTIESTGNITTSEFFEFTATGTTTFIVLYNIGASGSVASITDVSIVEVLGDKPRLDYDPLNPTCPHLLLEPQSTNLVTFSEDFSQWNTFNLTAETNTAINPKGTSGCYRIFVDNTTNSNLFLSTASIGTSYTISIYAKSNNANKDNFQLRIGDSRSSVFTATSDWQRFTYSATATGSNTFAVAIFTSSGTVSSDILIFGAQVETTAYATSYIPTAGATETRVGETCTNAGNVDTFNSTEGVLYAEIAALADDGTFRNISVGDGGVDNVVRLNYNTTLNRISFINRVGGSNTAFINYNATDITQYQKVAFKFKLNDFSVFANGLQIATDPLGAVNAANIFNTLKFDQGDGGSPFYGKVKSLATYNRALTDTELYTITSTQYSAYSGMVAALVNYTITC